VKQNLETRHTELAAGVEPVARKSKEKKKNEQRQQRKHKKKHRP
jgi:hypothetical protein